ncbi:hypothetical protein [Paenibacillus sp. FSL H8-0079]|uniref:hypothetical protein n=1 Tax=Paenibacillus sp. FSL H8-0079 TaxID=2921375 RepID=UPI0030EF2EDF
MAFYDSEFSRWKTQIIYRNDSCDICGNNKEENKDEQKCDNTDSIDVYTNTNGFWSFLRKASGQKRNPSRSSSSGTGDSNNNSFMHRIIYLQENTKLKLFLSLSMVMPLLIIMTNRLVLEDQWQSFCMLIGGLLIILGSSMFFQA